MWLFRVWRGKVVGKMREGWDNKIKNGISEFIVLEFSFFGDD